MVKEAVIARHAVCPVWGTERRRKAEREKGKAERLPFPEEERL